MSQDQKKDFDIIEFAAQASKFIEKNFKAALAIFIVAVLAGSAWSFKVSMDKEAEQEAFNALFPITKSYQDKKNDFEKAKDDKAQKDKGKKAAANDAEKNETFELPTGDLSKDYSDVVTQFETFMKNHKGKNAVGEAALILSELYTEYKMNEKGVQTLDTALKDWSNKDVVYYIMQMRAGDIHASSGDCNRAISNWQVVASSESFIANQAQLKLGVCLQKVGQIEQAKVWFEKIKAKAPNSTEGFNANRYLRYLKFKTNTQSAPEVKDTKVQNSSKNKDSRS